MSYDVSFMNRTEDGIEDITHIPEHDCLNITFNLHPMFAKAFEDDLGIKILTDMGIERAQHEIINAIINMIYDRKEMKKLNSPNGWGLYKYALPFLVQFAEACQEIIDLGYKNAYVVIEV